jgi:hypothetical protein
MVNNNDYFAIIGRKKGLYNYDLAYILSYINQTYLNNFFDSYIVINKYTPFFRTGETLEEIVFFDSYKKLRRDVTDKYD